MELAGVYVGEPSVLGYRRERPVLSAITKAPVTAPELALTELNLDGDRQADLSVHGGPSKAVYAYPSEHYAFWREAFPEMELPWGMFGENLTTRGLLEGDLNIGDRLRVGTAELMVTEPRMPCYKLGLRFGRDDVIKRFLRSGRSGFYFAVVREGDIGAGDAIEPIDRDAGGVTIADIGRLYTYERDNAALLRRAIQVAALPAPWRNYFSELLDKLEVGVVADDNR